MPSYSAQKTLKKTYKDIDKKLVNKIILIAITFFFFNLFKINVSELVADEVYYIPSALEYLEGNFNSNLEHPPLGKLFIALGINVFGNNPIGWRIFPLVFGTIGIVLVALAASVFFTDKNMAILSGLFVSTNSLWVFQSRVGSLDIMVTTMILLCVILYWDFLHKQNRSTAVFIGFCLGIAAAIKWTALFFFLVVIVMTLLINTFKQNYKIKLHLYIFIILFFSIGYLTPYLYFKELSLAEIFYNQMIMFNIHTFSYGEFIINGTSAPWTWFIYGFSTISKDSLILWSWPVVFIAFAYHSLRRVRQSWGEMYILINFILFYLPWFFVSRPTYATYTVTLIPYVSIATAYVTILIYNKYIHSVFVKKT